MLILKKKKSFSSWALLQCWEDNRDHNSILFSDHFILINSVDICYSGNILESSGSRDKQKIFCVLKELQSICVDTHANK